MELFNKKFVYFMWEDELEGKEGFLADDICELTNCVLGGDMHHAKVGKGLSLAFPFKDTDNNNDWLFFYYDPLYDVKRAYNEGKQIQWKGGSIEEWTDYRLKEFDPAFEYRIKPEEPKSRRMFYRELAEWLAKGNGQQSSSERSVRYTFQEVVKEEENKEVPADYRIRHWNSNEWIEPTVDIFIKDCRPVEANDEPYSDGC